MRDVGIFIWVALLVIGVVGSMISSLRRAAKTVSPGAPVPLREARLPDWAQQFVAAAPPPPRPAPPARPAPRPAPPPAPPRPVAPAEHETPRRPGRRLFGGKRELVRAVIAAEVLGKPRAFNDEYFGR
jgi:hypothetical protein